MMFPMGADIDLLKKNRLGGLLGPAMVDGVQYGGQPAFAGGDMYGGAPQVPGMPVDMEGPVNFQIDNTRTFDNTPNMAPFETGSNLEALAAAGLLAAGLLSDSDEEAAPLPSGAGLSRMNPMAINFLPTYGLLSR